MLLSLLYLGRKRRDLWRPLDLRRASVVERRSDYGRLLLGDSFEWLSVHFMALAESPAPVGTLSGLRVNPARYLFQFYF